MEYPTNVALFTKYIAIIKDTSTVTALARKNIVFSFFIFVFTFPLTLNFCIGIANSISRIGKYTILHGKISPENRVTTIKSFISKESFSYARKNTYETKNIRLAIIIESYEYDAASSTVVGNRHMRNINSLNFGKNFIAKEVSNTKTARFASLPKITRYTLPSPNILAILIPNAAKKYTLGIVFTGGCSDCAFS